MQYEYANNTLRITECNPNKLKRTIVVFVIVLQKVKMGLKVVKKLTFEDKKHPRHISFQIFETLTKAL